AAGDQDVDRDEDGEDGIPWQPTSEGGERETDDNADAGPGVGQHVFAICFQDHRMLALANPNQVAAESAVDENRQRGQYGSEPNILQDEASEPFGNGVVDDQQRGDDDQRALGARG